MTSPCMAADPVGSPLLHKPPKMVCTAMPRRPSYKGTLSPSDVVAGMAAARRNARRLAEDAQLLLDQGRWASASSLAVLSIEESGKVGVLRRLSLASEAPDLKAGWDGYGSHRRKLGHPLGLGEVFVPNALLSLADALTEAIDRRAETVGRGSESDLFGLHEARGNRRPVRVGFGSKRCPVREAASRPGSSLLGLKRSQAQQSEPMQMALAGHQLPRAFALALGTAAAHEAPMV